MYEIDLAATMGDLFGVYGQAEQARPARRASGCPASPEWMVVTRYDDIRAALSDPRLEIRSESFMRPDVPDDCLPYMRTMSEMNGAEHARLRKPSPRPSLRAGPRRSAPGSPRSSAACSTRSTARPTSSRASPAHCPWTSSAPWSASPRTTANSGAPTAGSSTRSAGPGFAAAIPGIMAGAKAAVARRGAPNRATTCCPTWWLSS